MLRRCFVSTASAAAAWLIAAWAYGDEGMWTFDHFPSANVAQEYGAEIGPEWLDRVRQSVVRLAGCTGSFVSDRGLVLTNNHCVAGCLAENSTRETSLIDSGVFARSRDEELRCSTQIADVLVEMQDITELVAIATRGLNDFQAKERRRETFTTLEQTCEDTSQTSGNPLKCEALTLYGGGQYWLYKYRRYTDLRLVLTPENAVAAFGGDPDNFQFPRWALDFAFLRAYVDGQPAETPNHLTIDFEGPQAGELVLVAGHPGSTDRQLTVAQLQALRDRGLPPSLLRASELRGRYAQFAKTSADAERIVNDPLSSLENTIKVQRKLLDALLDDGLFDRKRAEEEQLQRHVAGDRALRTAVGNPWERIAAAQEKQAALDLPYTFLEGAAGFNSRLFRYARLLVRGAAERPKANTERLPEYSNVSLPRIEQQLGAAVPVYPELERLTLSFSLERMREWLGPDHPVVRRMLATESPDTVADRLVAGSGLADAAARMALWNGGQSAIDASRDSMIVLARELDAEARELRTRQESQVDAVTEVAGEAIAKARFAALGTNVYPDATFTLRLNYGTVRGWEENGEPVPPFTQLDRLFERATGQPPFAVPESWQRVRASLDLATPVNLSSDNDIVGGNSGSPLLDASGKIVGLIFDGNIHSIAGAYGFNEARNRATSVHPAIIRAALRSVYQSDYLLEELSITD